MKFFSIISEKNLKILIDQYDSSVTTTRSIQRFAYNPVRVANLNSKRNNLLMNLPTVTTNGAASLNDESQVTLTSNVKSEVIVDEEEITVVQPSTSVIVKSRMTSKTTETWRDR